MARKKEGIEANTDRVAIPTVRWTDTEKIARGSSPSLATNAHDTLMVYKSDGTAQKTLYWNTVPSHREHSFETGYAPTANMNENGLVVTVHNNILGIPGYVYSKVGVFSHGKVSWHGSTNKAQGSILWLV